MTLLSDLAAQNKKFQEEKSSMATHISDLLDKNAELKAENDDRKFSGRFGICIIIATVSMLLFFIRNDHTSREKIDALEKRLEHEINIPKDTTEYIDNDIIMSISDTI